MTTAILTAGSSLWYPSRGSGVVTLLLLTLSLALGILTSMRWSAESTPRFVTGDLHRNVSLLSLVFLAIHVASVVIDGFAPIGWLRPSSRSPRRYRPIWLGLGRWSPTCCSRSPSAAACGAASRTAPGT